MLPRFLPRQPLQVTGSQKAGLMKESFTLSQHDRVMMKSFTEHFLCNRYFSKCSWEQLPTCSGRYIITPILQTAQKEEITCSWSHGWCMVELGFEPRSSVSKISLMSPRAPCRCAVFIDFCRNSAGVMLAAVCPLP